MVVLRGLAINDRFIPPNYVSCLVNKPHDDTILGLLAQVVVKPRSMSRYQTRFPPLRAAVNEEDEDAAWGSFTRQNVEKVLVMALTGREGYIFYRDEDFRHPGPFADYAADQIQSLALREAEAEILAAIARRVPAFSTRYNPNLPSILDHWRSALNDSFLAITPRMKLDGNVPDHQSHLQQFAQEALVTAMNLSRTSETGRGEQVINGYWRNLGEKVSEGSWRALD
ncbi:hypothetical protein FRB90_002511 [Tulasnella sp. 427]|nr:hypothetical protein FRB90_002511 [Tulasnella sp. 427]